MYYHQPRHNCELTYLNLPPEYQQDTLRAKRNDRGMIEMQSADVLGWVVGRGRWLS